MERRRFLAAAATGAGWAQAPPPAAAKVISSVMLWTLPGSFEDKLAAVSRAGIQSVELLDEHARWTAADIEQARRKLRSFNLHVDLISAAPVSPLDMAEVARHLSTARRLGASLALLLRARSRGGSPVSRCWWSPWLPPRACAS